jgi:hypothetical protein
MCTVLEPHFKSGLKKFFLNVSNMVACIGKVSEKGVRRSGNALRVFVQIRDEILMGPQISA